MRSTAVRLAAFGANGRKFFVGGNWKANGTASQVKQWVSVLNSGLVPSSTEVVVAPPAVFLTDVAKTLRKDFHVAGQDAFATTGAHTGETSASMLKDAGLSYAIIGHSERRQKGESNEVVATKAKAAIEQGLTVIACLGETLAERDAGKTSDVVVGQLAAYAKNGACSPGVGGVGGRGALGGLAFPPIPSLLLLLLLQSPTGARLSLHTSPSGPSARARRQRPPRRRRCTRASAPGSTRTSARRWLLRRVSSTAGV
jgi:hypothetical protein